MDFRILSESLRFFKRGKARYEDRTVHAHRNADGPVGYLRGDMEHYDRRGLEVYMAKHNVHSTNEAQAIVREMEGIDDDALPPKLFAGTPSPRCRMTVSKQRPRRNNTVFILQFVKIFKRS